MYTREAQTPEQLGFSWGDLTDPLKNIGGYAKGLYDQTVAEKTKAELAKQEAAAAKAQLATQGGFMSKYGTILVIGGVAVAALLLLRK